MSPPARAARSAAREQIAVVERAHASPPVEHVGELGGAGRDELAARVEVVGDERRDPARRARPRRLRRTRGSPRDSPTVRGSRPRRGGRRAPPTAISHSPSAAEPSDRNCFHGSELAREPGEVRPSRPRPESSPTTRSRTPSRNAPPPRTAVTRTPVAWFTTSPASAPSASSAQIDVAQYGMPREQFVDPSTGSSTTVIVAPSRSCTPDSSLTIRTGARCRTRHASASATRSSAY